MRVADYHTRGEAGGLPRRHRGPARRACVDASPAVLFTAVGLTGVAISVTGDEMAQKYGWARVVLWAMTAAAALSLATGWTTGVSVVLAASAVLLWNVSIYLDSAALTAGIVQAADKHLRGATMGLHSMAGYVGGFLGPLGVGWFLDLAGGDGVLGWGLGFGHLAAVMLAGRVVLRRLGRTEHPLSAKPALSPQMSLSGPSTPAH